MAYLSGRDHFADRQKFPLPDLIVTDLGFRGEDGLHFLNWLHYQADCRVPIVCMTGSSDPEKLTQARNFGARCIPKTAVYEDVVELIRSLLPQAQ
jgi:DNA-binding response OmpR family regulator